MSTLGIYFSSRARPALNPGSVNADPGFFWWLGADQPDRVCGGRGILAVWISGILAPREVWTPPQRGPVLSRGL